MSCNTNRCALRRFDGHGVNSASRPTNTQAARELETSLQRIMAERENQNAGVFTLPRSALPQSQPGIINKATWQPQQAAAPDAHEYYSLSDSNIRR